MKVNVTSSKGLESKLSVTITKKEIQKQIDTRLDEVKGTINLKGFRPGKAPRELLKKQFGKALYSEVIEKTLNETTFKALKEKNIKPAGQPKIDIKSSGENKDLEFTIEVEKFPEIKKINLGKIEIEKFDKSSIPEIIKSLTHRMSKDDISDSEKFLISTKIDTLKELN